MSDDTFPQVPEDPSDSMFPSLEELAALLAQYEFHELIGTGGMGAVYLARQYSLDRWVAIKVLPRSASQNPEDAARFITEARSMAKLTHSHIVAVYDFGQTVQGQLYLVMEYVKGHDLHHHIHQGDLNETRIRALVRQLCEALQYAHEHSIIHRDIKPANILINEDWQAKIVDFGLASHQSMVMTDVEYGTPEYVAPERLETGAVVDHRADIYALGVVIHEMFTRKTPQAAGSSAMSGMPEAFTNVIARCTAPSPTNRFQKAGDILTYLATADAVRSPAPKAAAKAPAPPPHLQARVKRPSRDVDTGPQGNGEAMKWLWAAAVVVLLAVGYWFIQNQRTKGPAPAMVTAESKKDESTPPPPSEAPAKEEPKMAESGPKPTEPVPTPETPKMADVPEGPFKLAPGDFSIEKRLKGHEMQLYACAILADQRRVVTSGRDNAIRLWDAATGKELKKYTSPIDTLSNMSPSRHGTQILLTSAASDQAAIFDVETGKTIATVRAPSRNVQEAFWGADESSVFITCRDTNGGVYRWEPATGPKLTPLEWPQAAYQVLIERDPSTLAAQNLLITGATIKLDPAPSTNNSTGPRYINDKPMAGIFSLDGKTKLGQPSDYSGHYNRLSMSPDGTRAAGGSQNYAVFDAQTFKRLVVLSPPGANTFTMHSAWLAGGRLLVVSSVIDNKTTMLRLIEADTGNELARLDLGGLRATQLAVSPEGSWMLATGFSVNGNDTKPEHFDGLIIRLPDFSKMGTDKGIAAFAGRQLARLSTVDPELDGQLKAAVTAPGLLLGDEPIIAQVRDLTTKYGAALKRAAATAAPKDQPLMIAEADAIAAGAGVPDATTDAATTGEHLRFRGIYRQQLAQLEAKRKQSAETVHQTFEASAKALAATRSQAGDRLGAARCTALLTSLADLKPFTEVVASAFTSAKPVAAPTVAATPPPPASSTPSPAPAVPSGQRLQRTGKPGELIKIERTTKNGYVGNNRSRVGSVPPNIGPVLQVVSTDYHGIALLPDGSLKSWGSWDGESTAHSIPAEAKDVVLVQTTGNESAALLADGRLLVWNETGENRFRNTPKGVAITAIKAMGNYGFYALGADGSATHLTTYNVIDGVAVPSGTTDVVDLSGDYETGWFAAKKDGSILHWGKDNLYIGQQHTTVKDALAVAVSDEFLVVLHQDGTVNGWGASEDRQRFRVRKYPGALRVLPDPAGRIFLIEKAGGEWAAELNPSNYEYHEEQRLGTIEGKLKGCTSVALSSMYVFAVKPAP
ncbi:MAG: protein kinase [Verrucomicrobiaceae bacterium]|nr:protein kinase [Verrucomicrobiaceae bacterium]